LFDKNPNWQPSHICLVVRQQIKKEMNKEIVKASWGEPDKIKDLDTYELWWYWYGTSLCDESIMQNENDINTCKENMESRDMIAFNKFDLYFFSLFDR